MVFKGIEIKQCLFVTVSQSWCHLSGASLWAGGAVNDYLIYFQYVWASAEADCHIIIFCKASIQEACQSQSNCETLCRQYDCVGVHQEDRRNLFLLPLYQRSQTLVQILSKKGNGKTTIWVNFRRKSGSKMRFCYTVFWRVWLQAVCFHNSGCFCISEMSPFLIYLPMLSELLPLEDGQAATL